MRYGSVCSGIEAASVSWLPLGWDPQWFSEIERFPCDVLQTRHPDVPNLGDMTKIHEREEFRERSIDLLVGGTPCQSFSIAGLRKGLRDPRGNLTLVFLSLVARARPRWVVWENVPGVLSDDGGRTFGTFLGGLAKLGYGFAYRILDAQYFGVPQRRRRVFVVGHSGGAWQRAAAVLFERQSLSWDSPPRREARSQVTGTFTSRTSGGGGFGTDFECDGGLVAVTLLAKGSLSHDNTQDALITHTLRGEGFDASEDKTATTILQQMRVRRLTPRECERLQGFPDDYTLIERNGKLAADGSRYKAIGNSMAVPVMRWIGERIQMVEAIS